jgi:hypothetical protein
MEIVKDTIDDRADQQRRLPWLIDIFLYPISTSGLVIAGIFVLTAIFVDLIITALTRIVPFLSLIIPIALIILDIIITGYLFWYLGMCIERSASGETRSPDILNKLPQQNWEIAQETIQILCSLFICLGPGLIYYLNVNRTDWIFWSLIIAGSFFLPMAVLSVEIFDSLSGLSPMIIIPSIIGTFLKYCQLLMACSIPAGLIVIIAFFFHKQTMGIFQNMLDWAASFLTGMTGIPVGRPESSNGIISFVLRGVFAYLLMMTAHIIGRFYYLNEKKLNWEV